MLWLHAVRTRFQMPLPLMLTLATCTTFPQHVLRLQNTLALVGSPLSILCNCEGLGIIQFTPSPIPTLMGKGVLH
jgi:hypothetical protein